MSTKKTVLILLCVLMAVISLVVYNAFFSFDRKFTLLLSDKYNICFLISNDYSYEITQAGFKYHGQKNHGDVFLKRDGFSADILKVKMNGFKAGYSKEKNYRIYEYEIADSLILVDRFEYAQKAPMNLVPYRRDCQAFKQQFPDQKVIFNEQ